MLAPLMFRLAVIAAPLLALALPAHAEGYTLTIKDHRFTPETLKVKSNEAFDITVINSDSTAEEFESSDLHVEKVVQGGKQITVHVDSLAPGTYGFVGEHHEDTAIGNVIAE